LYCKDKKQKNKKMPNFMNTPFDFMSTPYLYMNAAFLKMSVVHFLKCNVFIFFKAFAHRL
jgi:hypothetical protein